MDEQIGGQGAPRIRVTKFWTAYDDVAGKPGEPRAVDWCEWVKVGGNGATTQEKVARLRQNELLWPVIDRAYEHWKKGQEEPVDGTPLAAWAGVNADQADRLKLMHIRSVEDVAALTDADLEKIGMGARSLREKARAFVVNKQGSAKIEEALAARDKENADLKAELAELQETVKTLAAQAGMQEKRAPGRPPKQAA
jgi:hypothetical protein